MRRAFSIAWKALAFGAAPILLMAWCNRPLDPDAWRNFSRTATDTELQEELPSDDGGREQVDRWNRYLTALAQGDEEALRVAARLCAGLDGHVTEEFLSALGWNLEREPAKVFELERRCFPAQVTSCDRWFCLDEPPDAVAERASVEKRREAVRALLDGGWSAEASACLNRLRD